VKKTEESKVVFAIESICRFRQGADFRELNQRKQGILT
jgi:hypothetical protein